MPTLDNSSTYNTPNWTRWGIILIAALSLLLLIQMSEQKLLRVEESARLHAQVYTSAGHATNY